MEHYCLTFIEIDYLKFSGSSSVSRSATHDNTNTAPTFRRPILERTNHTGNNTTSQVCCEFYRTYLGQIIRNILNVISKLKLT